MRASPIFAKTLSQEAIVERMPHVILDTVPGLPLTE
jgi:hypothetical protein